MKIKTYITHSFLLHLCALSLCSADFKEQIQPKQIAHQAVFYKEDYVSADYDPILNLTNKPNSLLKSEKLIFDYSTHPRKLHRRHHKNKHNDESLKRVKRETIHNEYVLQNEIKHLSRQKRQYFQQPVQINPLHPWNTGYSNYYVTPNLVSYYPPPPPIKSDSKYYLSVGNGNLNKIPIRGIYHNPISVPGKPFINAKPEVSVGTRFGEDEYFEDRPVWGVRYEKAPLPSSRTSVSAGKRPTTVSTPPPLLHGRRENTQLPLLNGRQSESSTTVTQTPSFTPNRPQERRPSATPVPTTPDQLSKCVWAIVSCCSRDSPQIRYNCFEQMGCTGAFWGLNPCANEIQDSAIDAADNYFS